MVNLIRDPKGESVMEPSNSTDKAVQQQIQILKPLTSSQQDEVARLKQRVTELEKELHGKVCEIQSILNVSKLSYTCISTSAGSRSIQWQVITVN